MGSARWSGGAVGGVWDRDRWRGWGGGRGRGGIGVGGGTSDEKGGC